MFENTAKYFSSSSRSSSSFPPSLRTPARVVVPRLRDLPLKERQHRGLNFAALQGSWETAMPGLLRAPSAQHVVQPVPGHTQGLSPRHGQALCPRLAATHSSGTEQLLPNEITQLNLYIQVTCNILLFWSKIFFLPV